MSERVLAIVRNRRFGDTTLKHVLKRLAWATQDDGSKISVSIETLGDDCELPGNTIRRALRKAERLGICRLMDREQGRWPRVYSLDVPYLTNFPLTKAGGRREEPRGAPL